MSERMSWLQDESALRWNLLEDEPDACIVVSERMELVYLNEAARRLVPADWFGKRCFEVLPTADKMCALHCPKIAAVSESSEVVYCEETTQTDRDDGTYGVGLIPLGSARQDEARAVFVLRRKDLNAREEDFKARLVDDAGRVRSKIARAES